MLAMPIHKDLTKYQPKVALGLSGRMLAFSAIAVGTTVGLACFFWFVLRIPYSDVMIICMLASVPGWALGFWRPSGMALEKWLPYLVRHISTSARLTYSNKERFAALQAAGDERKEANGTDIATKTWKKLRRARAIERWEPGNPAGD